MVLGPVITSATVHQSMSRHHRFTWGRRYMPTLGMSDRLCGLTSDSVRAIMAATTAGMVVDADTAVGIFAIDAKGWQQACA